jgi:hypothetical protein
MAGPTAVARAPGAYLHALGTGAGASARLQHGLDLVPGLVPGCHHASVTTPLMRGLAVRAATDGTARRADELQHELVEGPCLQALRTGHSVIAHDLVDETRWTRWRARAATELGLGSALSVLLLPGSRPLGTLNLYSHGPHGLSDVDISLLHALAEPLCATLVDLVRFSRGLRSA